MSGASAPSPAQTRKRELIFEITLHRLIGYWKNLGFLTEKHVDEISRNYWLTREGVTLEMQSLGDGWLLCTIYGRTLEVLHTTLNDAMDEMQQEAVTTVEDILGFSPLTHGTTLPSTPTSPAPSSSSTSRDLSGRASGLGSSYVLLREIPGFY